MAVNLVTKCDESQKTQQHKRNVTYEKFIEEFVVAEYLLKYEYLIKLYGSYKTYAIFF